MNKTAIKNFAIWARNKLIADISYKAGLLGITEKEIKAPLPQSTKDAQFFDIGSREPYQITGAAIAQRKALADKISEKARQSNYVTAYKAVIEEVAYTWFNRLIAVRFMEVNDYLPSRVRVLSGTGGKNEPDIVTTPFDTGLDFTAAEREFIVACKTDNNLDELFRMLFIRQCNALNAILPELFEKIGDYSELLLNISFTDKDGVVSHLVDTEELPEEDWHKAVEIIGWMYQYYNSEPKDVLINARSKYKMDDIPFVTQLFTSDWIVRFMVENTLGRYWLDGHWNDSIKANWNLYLDEAEQVPEAQAKLKKIRMECKGMSPEDITFIDPCMGSGHILVYAFDVFIQMYESAGYSQRDAAQSILEKNLFGLDIDKRAYQLAYFALLMKARQYNRRIFDSSVAPQVYHPAGWQDGEYFGSLLQIADPGEKSKEQTGQLTLMDENYDNTLRVWNFKRLLVQKYDIVCTNPPYLNSSYMPDILKKHVEDNYKDYKSDLFTAFFVKVKNMCSANGHIGLLSPYVWMFISSHEKARELIIKKSSITALVQLEYNAFEAACIPVAAFSFRNQCIDRLQGEYIKLSDFKGIENQEPKTLEAVKNRECGYRYTASADNFAKIPGSPVAYWVGTSMLNAFDKSKSLDEFAPPKQGLITGDNDLFLKLWYEVSAHKIALTRDNSKKWYPINKGGEFRRWYGNQDYILDWEDNGCRIKNFKDSNGKLRSRPQNLEYNFNYALSWSLITSSKFSVRYYPDIFAFNVAGISCFPKSDIEYLLGLLNTKIVEIITKIINPTLNMNVGDVAKVPVIISHEHADIVKELVSECITCSRTDWDSLETSWDFKRHPLIANVILSPQKIAQEEQSGYIVMNTLQEAFENWKCYAEQQFFTLKTNEEELNRMFIDIYGLQDELTPEVEDKDVTVARIYNTKEDIPESMKGNGYVLTRADVIKSFVSYAVGCMFGRYSLDVEGLVLAGENLLEKFTLYGTLEEENEKKPNGNLVVGFDKVYGLKGMDKASFQPDRDNIIPITDEEYLPDDIVARFVEFVRAVYGSDTLEENLRFIADALGSKGSTTREIIRNYFLRDFFKDHVKTYKKRPIYWLFDSGKADGFKALIYLHRYDQDTVGKLRVDYLHKLQRVYESEIARMRDTIEKSGDAREVSAAQKRLEKLIKQLKEAKEYDEKIAHLALARIALNLDDGVKVNYEKLQTGSDGKKYEVLGKLV